MINAADIEGFRLRPCPAAHVRALAFTCAALLVGIAAFAAGAMLHAALHSNSDRPVVVLSSDMPQPDQARRPGPPHLPAGNLLKAAR